MFKLTGEDVAKITEEASNLYGENISIICANSVIGALTRWMDDHPDRMLEVQDIEELKAKVRSLTERKAMMRANNQRQAARIVELEDLLKFSTNEAAVEKRKSFQLSELNTRQSEQLTRLRAEREQLWIALIEIRNRVQEGIPVIKS